MARMGRAIRIFVAMAAVWSGAMAADVLLQHQVLRADADDPQVQLAEDAARRLAGGADPQSVLPGGDVVAIESSLAPWLAVYDAAGAPLASSGKLRAAAPKMPGDLLQVALAGGGLHRSWQPQPGVRQALVIVPVRQGVAGFAVAGRSLREVEARKQQVAKLALVVWGLGLAGLALLALLLPSRRD
jgi:hypothetical protein